jgi:hypothetical protein
VVPLTDLKLDIADHSLLTECVMCCCCSYGAEQGQGALREKIATNLYGGRIKAEEVCLLYMYSYICNVHIVTKTHGVSSAH